MLELLTKRERETLSLMAQGLSNREIAKKMFLSICTVRDYTIKIYNKFDLSRATDSQRVKAVSIYQKENKITD